MSSSFGCSGWRPLTDTESAALSLEKNAARSVTIMGIPDHLVRRGRALNTEQTAEAEFDEYAHDLVAFIRFKQWPFPETCSLRLERREGHENLVRRADGRSEGSRTNGAISLSEGPVSLTVPGLGLRIVLAPGEGCIVQGVSPITLMEVSAPELWLIFSDLPAS